MGNGINDHPDYCPICGSVDVVDGKCTHCGSAATSGDKPHDDK